MRLKRPAALQPFVELGKSSETTTPSLGGEKDENIHVAKFRQIMWDKPIQEMAHATNCIEHPKLSPVAIESSSTGASNYLLQFR